MELNTTSEHMAKHRVSGPMLMRLVMFLLLPWIELNKLRLENARLYESLADRERLHEFRRAELYQSWADLQAAHKGLRRLNKKLKKYKSET